MLSQQEASSPLGWLVRVAHLARYRSRTQRQSGYHNSCAREAESTACEVKYVPCGPVDETEAFSKQSYKQHRANNKTFVGHLSCDSVQGLMCSTFSSESEDGQTRPLENAVRQCLNSGQNDTAPLWKRCQKAGDDSHDKCTNTTKESNCSGRNACGTAVDTFEGNLDGQMESQSAQHAVVHVLLRRIRKLETRLQTHVQTARMTHAALCEQLATCECNTRAIDRLYETARQDLEENQKRVGKTEQYLDAMRRDLAFATLRKRGAVMTVARAVVHNMLYYCLAYLVPVLAGGARLIRGTALTFRRGILARGWRQL